MSDGPAQGPAAQALGLNRILVLSFSDLANDPRVSRQIDLLASRFRVTAAGFAKPAATRIDCVPLRYLPRPLARQAWAVAMLKLGSFEGFYWSSPTIRHAFQALKGTDFDLVLANDLTALPLACALKPRRGVIFDAHEYSPRELEDRFYWRFLYRGYNHYLCRKYLPETAGMLTVSRGIADEYRAHYGVEPAVLMNAPPYHDLAPRPTSPDRINIVHHGVAVESRRIELMIRMMDHLDERFHLDLFLLPSASRYFDQLVSLAARRPRVRILPPVPMAELPALLNEYDVGVYLLPPTSFNNEHALPNKFFEFIQARLAVGIGPSPEMARLVQRYDCGVVADDFDPRSLARQLKSLDAARIDAYKQRSHLAARDLCFERNSDVLLGMINRLLGVD
jgi:hypothetical protein